MILKFSQLVIFSHSTIFITFSYRSLAGFLFKLLWSSRRRKPEVALDFCVWPLCALEWSDLKSENSGLPVELHMLTVQCNLFGQHQSQKAGSKTSLSSESDGKGQGVNLALLIIGRKYVTLEEKQNPKDSHCGEKRRRVTSRFRQFVSLPSYLWHSLLNSWIILASGRHKLSRLYWLYHLLMF